MVASGRWSLLAKTPWTARSSHSLTVTRSGVVALYGGEFKPRTPVDSARDSETQESILKGSVHTLDLKTGQFHSDESKWQTLRPTVSSLQSDVPDPRVGATVVSEGDRIYMWGGRGGVDMAPFDKSQIGLWSAKLDAGTGVVQWENVNAVNEDEAPEARSYHASTIFKVFDFDYIPFC